jgi:hypothetical protein
MAANATNSVDLAIQRQLALLLEERLPDVSIELAVTVRGALPRECRPGAPPR